MRVLTPRRSTVSTACRSPSTSTRRCTTTGTSSRTPRGGASASTCPTTTRSRGTSRCCAPSRCGRACGRRTARRRCSPPSRTRGRSRRSARWHEAGHFIHITSHRAAARRPRPRAGSSGSACPTTSSTAPTTRSPTAAIGIDVLIDDSPDNLERALDAGMVAATILHPWNRELCETEDVICTARLGGARAQPGAGARVSDPPGAARPAPGDDLRHHLPAIEPDRTITDWGRSERVEGLVDRTVDVPLPLLVPLRGGGDRARAGHRRRAAGGQPRRRPAARRLDDRQGDQGGASAPAPAPPDGRALLQGLSVLLHVRHQDRRRARPSGQRPSPAPRRAAARARLPGGRQGDGEALQGPLQAAALRARRLRRGGRARRRADRPGGRGGRGGGDADVRPRRPPASASPASSTSRSRRSSRTSGCSARPTSRPSSAPLPAAGADGPARRRERVGRPRAAAGDRRRDPRADPGRGGRHRRRTAAPCGSDERAPRPHHGRVHLLGRPARAGARARPGRWRRSSA